MSSVFGMNNVEFSGNSWAIKDEFAFMCKSIYVARVHRRSYLTWPVCKIIVPISVAVIFVSSLFAFNTWIRSFIWYYGNVPLVTRLMRTPLYNLWLNKAKSIKTMNRKGYQRVNGLRADIMQERFEKEHKTEHSNTETQSNTADRGGPTNTPNAPSNSTRSETESRQPGFGRRSLLRLSSSLRNREGGDKSANGNALDSTEMGNMV